MMSINYKDSYSSPFLPEGLAIECLRKIDAVFNFSIGSPKETETEHYRGAETISLGFFYIFYNWIEVIDKIIEKY